MSHIHTSSNASRRTMSRVRTSAYGPRQALVIGALLAVTGGGALTAAADAAPAPHSPGACITANGGDYTACNVGGHEGQGSSSGTSSGTAITNGYSPDQCIRVNVGDATACNVGSHGGGAAPYRPVA